MHKLRRLVARAAVVGAAALTTTLIYGAGVASAAPPADPQGGATPVAPHFYNGNVEGIRDTGSDTTFFMMQKIGDLFTGAGLYGCTLNTTAGQTLFNSGETSTSANESYYCQAGQNVATTDVNDNWDRTEVTEGVDNVGSGAGQNQLCSTADTPLPVDFARSSKPSTGACSTEVQTGYAKDGVPIIDYPITPALVANGTVASPLVSTTAPYSSYGVSGGKGTAGLVGPVALGWEPGDPLNGPYSGTALVDISNADQGSGSNSLAYRLWCATGGTGTTARITDWGQLTNLGTTTTVANVSTTAGSATITGSFPSLAANATSPSGANGVGGPGITGGTWVEAASPTSVTLSVPAAQTGTQTLTFTTLAEGQGTPIGIPIRLMGVNTSSGTESTFASFANDGTVGTGCSSNMNTNSPGDPNPATAPTPNSAHIALENNSDQLDEFAIQDFPTPDYVDQAIEVATSLYIESNGVFNTNPYAAAATIDGVSYSGNKITEGGLTPTTPNLLNNLYPTSRTLFNIYRTDTVRASTAGFLNWICDSNTNFSKGLDNTTGKNFDAELQTIISSTFGFPRLTDLSPAPAISTPADGIPAPGNSCAASLNVVTSSGSPTITLVGGGSFPPDIVNAGALVGGGNVGVTSPSLPAGTTVVSGAGTSTLTLSSSATATSASTSAVFAGVPPVTAVANPET
jgi:hypothetical protein